MLELRPYQQSAIRGLYDYFEANDGNPLIVLPTGTGKSLVIADFTRGALEAWPTTRVIILTHVKELIAQNYAELVKLWPGAPAGIYSAGLNKRDLHAQILFAGIQSIHRRWAEIERCDLVLVDEAHLIPRKGGAMYQNFLHRLRTTQPQMKVIGLTATPYRMDSGMLHEGDDALFDAIAYEYPILDAIQDGYLSPVLSKATETALDVTGVGTRGGEFIPGDLEAAVDIDETNRAIVSEIIAKGQNRGSWLVFAAGVSHARHLCELIGGAGYPAAVVTGDTPARERDTIIAAFKAGRYRALVNVSVLTTGFNAPGVDLIAMARPTKSIGLYVQMIGRGTRLANGKDDCLVLDFAGNLLRHGPIDRVDGRRKKPGDGEAPVKTCPECDSIVFAGVRECPDCGYQFPPPEPKLEAKADKNAVVLSIHAKPVWLDVVGVRYERHEKPEKPPSMRVTYDCGLTEHREWICFEHTGYPRQKAASWWARRQPGSPVPNTVAEALERAPREIPRPAAITVRQSGKYTEIENYRFGAEEAA